jgi:sulfur-oxidizing protein SoxX
MRSSVKKTVVVAAALLLVWGCDPQSRGFALPEGDVQRGEMAYTALQCNSCHSRSNSSSLGVEGIDIRLGGTVTKVDSYAGLVTSIINPSHRIKRNHKDSGELPDGTSAMQTYNEVMTVQQLVDLVTMLQPEYNVAMPVYPYGMYH